MNSLHIVHVVRDLDNRSGGLTRAVAQLSEALLEQGITGTLCYQNRGNEISELAPELRRLERTKLTLLDRCGLSNEIHRSLLDLQRQNPISLFHLHGLWDGLTNATARFAQKHNIEYICSTHGMLAPWSLNHKRWKKLVAWHAYQKTNLQRAVALHATADHEAANLAALGLRPPRIVIGNGIPKSPTVNLDLRQTKPRIALVLSRIHPVKGIEMLIEAWRNLRPEGWICQIVGPGEKDYLESLRDKIESSGLKDQIELCPPLDDQEKWKAYERASLFVLPSFTENFGIVVAEALSMQLPVITTTGTPWSMLPESDCGWYIEPNTEQLQHTLKTALSLPKNKLNSMGKNGKILVDAQFGWSTIAKKFADQYRQLI